jgi:cell division protein FtsI (penicillin-binding protein 3)
MSPIDHNGYRPPSTLSQFWRWLVESMWRIEHAFERNKAEGRAVDDARLRIFLVLTLFGLGFIALGAEASKRALFSHLGGAGVEAAPPPEARADLVDRNGELLATDVTQYSVYLDPRDISPGHEQETRDELADALPRLSADRLDKAMKGGRRAFLIGDLNRQERDLVHDLGRPGVEFQEVPKRVYPLGPTAAHLIGFADTGGHGLAGAERALDAPIRGAAAGGGQVALSIDLRVQAALESELAKAAAKFQTVGAMGMVVDVHTGEILALSSLPNFDPNDPGRSPMGNQLNQVAQSRFELGSVFKAFTLAAGLDSGIVTPNTMFDVHAPLQLGDGRAVHDFDKGDTTLALWQVFTHSSNIGAAKLSLMAGPDRMSKYFKSFGLFAAAPSELAESTRPLLPKKLGDETLAQIAFGQGIAVSPLALATGYTAVMNGGLYIPLTIKKAPDGYQPPATRVISEKTSATMLQLMRMNVHDDPKGSGHKADDVGLRVGGKTGSAQKPENGHYGKNNISSFVGVFPTDGGIAAKRYLVLITLDSPHVTKDSAGFITAGWNAAPTAGAVIDRIAPFLGVARTPAAITAPLPVLTAPVAAPEAESTQ